MIVVVADETALEGAEQIVGAAIRAWSAEAGGVAVFRCHVPESRGGSVEVDALVCTPQGATVVEVKGFTVRQDGVLATPPNGPWTIDGEPAALYHAVRVPNPFVQVRRQVFAAKNLLQQSGIFGWVNAVIALVPQPGAELTIEETRIADGYRAVLVERDDSSALRDYFNAETGRTVRLSIADVGRVFAGLNLRHLLPAPHELAAQGFPAELDPATTGRPAAPPSVELGATGDSAEVATSGSARMTSRIAQATTPAFLAAIDRLAHRPSTSSAADSDSDADESDSAATVSADQGQAHAPGVDEATVTAAADEHDSGRFDDPSTAGAGSNESGGESPVQADDDEVAEREEGEPAERVVSLRKHLPADVASGARGAAASGFHGSERESANQDAADGPETGPSGMVFEAGSGWRSGVASYRTTPVADPADQAGEKSGSRSAAAGAALGAATIGAAAAHSTTEPGQRPDPGDDEDRANPDDAREHEPDTREPSADSHHRVESTPSAERVNLRKFSEETRESPGLPHDDDRTRASTPVRHEHSQRPFASPRGSSGGPYDTRQPDDSTQESSGASHPRYESTGYAERDSARTSAESDPYGHAAHWSDWVDRDRQAQRSSLVDRVRERLRGGGGPSLLEQWRNRPVRERGERQRRLRVGPGLGLILFIALFGAGFFAITAVQASRFEMSDYDRMCAERKPFPNAAAYQSSGARPIYLSGALAEMVIPDQSGAWHPRDTSSVQLIACMTQLDLRDLVQTCQYAPVPGAPVGRTVNLFRATYEIVVYEAHSGREVARASMLGERYSADPSNTDPDRCRAAADAPDFLGRRLGQPSAAQVTGFLTPLVRTDH